MSPVRRLPIEPLPAPREKSDGVEEIELADLPAAVVCATCGESDCPGCALEPARDTRSGLVVFVPWERPQASLWSRFWTTSRLTTESAETFFASMPDGPVSPALSYALLAETLAVGTTVLAWTALGIGVMYALLPTFTLNILASSAGRAGLVRMSGVAWIAFTAVLLLAHVLHGYFLDREARRVGATSKPSRAFRFGFYAAGWDVAQSPIGFVAMLVTRGPRAFGDAIKHATTTPGRATTALLRGVYGLEGALLATVKQRSMRWTMVASVAVICVGLSAVVGSMFLGLSDRGVRGDRGACGRGSLRAEGPAPRHLRGSSWTQPRRDRSLLRRRRWGAAGGTSELAFAVGAFSTSTLHGVVVVRDGTSGVGGFAFASLDGFGGRAVRVITSRGLGQVVRSTSELAFAVGASLASAFVRFAAVGDGANGVDRFAAASGDRLGRRAVVAPRGRSRTIVARRRGRGLIGMGDADAEAGLGEKTQRSSEGDSERYRALRRGGHVVRSLVFLEQPREAGS